MPYRRHRSPLESFERAAVKFMLLLVGIMLASAFIAGRASADTLYVTEFPNASPTIWQAAPAPPTRSSVVAISASSTQSLAFTTSTTLVRLHCDVACFVEVGGTNPTATTSSAKMVAGQTEYFLVVAGAKVAVLIDSTP